MIKPCPYCGEENPGPTRPVDVVVEDEVDVGPPVSMDSGAASPEPMSFTTRDAMVYDVCGHAFWRDDLEAVLDVVDELERLERERRTTEDPDRYERLDQVEIPVVRNRVRNRTRECERVEDAEGLR